MTHDAIAEILELVDVYYPDKSQANDMTKQAKILKAWEYALKDVPDEVGKAAAMNFFRHSPFPPHVSDIVNYAEKIKDAAQDNGLEKYWDESYKAICGDITFDELSDVSKAYWKNQRNIDEAGLSEDTVIGVIRGQMFKVLPEIIEKIKTKRDTPENVLEIYHTPEGKELTARQRRLYELERDRMKDAEQLPESSDDEKAERSNRWLRLVGSSHQE